MSGEDKSTDASNWEYAHILWQRHGLRMEEFAEMPRSIQLAYIASEQLEDKYPIEATNRLAKVYIKKK